MHPTPTPRTAAACPGGAASSCPWSPPTPHGATAAAPWSPPLQPFAPPPSGPLAGCTAVDLCASSPAVWAPPPAASAPPLACLPMLPASAALRRRVQRHGRRRSVLHRRLHLSSILAPRRAPMACCRPPDRRAPGWRGAAVHSRDATEWWVDAVSGGAGILVDGEYPGGLASSAPGDW